MNEQQMQNLRLTLIMKYLELKGEWPELGQIDQMVHYIIKPSVIFPTANTPASGMVSTTA